MVIINPLSAAKKLRQQYKEKDVHCFLGSILKNYDAVVQDYQFHDEINAFCFRHEGIFFLGVNKNRNRGEKNFIIAHELGHYILLHSKTISLNLKIDHCLSLNNFSAMDIQANLFAAELLMPENLFRKFALSGKDVTGLTKKFSVSKEAVLYQIKSLNL